MRVRHKPVILILSPWLWAAPVFLIASHPLVLRIYFRRFWWNVFTSIFEWCFFSPHDVLFFSLVFIRTLRYPSSLILYHLYPYDHPGVIIVSALYINPQVIRSHNVQSIDNWLYCLICGKQHFSDNVSTLIIVNNQRLYECTYIPLTVVWLSSYILLLSTHPQLQTIYVSTLYWSC